VALAIGPWLISSMAMNFINKHAVDIFEASSLLVILQMIISALVLLVLEYRRMAIGKWVDLAKWSLVPVLFAGVLATSLWALKVSSVSTVLILRNALPLVTLIIDKLLLGASQPVTELQILSILVVLGGTVIYSHWNVAVTSHGVALMIFNCVLIAVDRSLQSHLLKSPDFSMTPPMCSLVNNVLGIVPMLVLAAATNEVGQWGSVVGQVSKSTWCWVLVSGCCGCSLGYFALLAQKILSVTSFLMLQNLNKIFVVLLGVFVMGDSMPGLSAIGCVLSMLGSICYCYFQLPAEIDMQVLAKEPLDVGSKTHSVEAA